MEGMTKWNVVWIGFRIRFTILEFATEGDVEGGMKWNVEWNGISWEMERSVEWHLEWNGVDADRNVE